MAYKGIRIVALMSVLMAAVWFALLAWAIFWSGTEGEPASFKTVSQALSFVLVLLAILASYASHILERQADQIALLERNVAELQSASSRRTG
ncbi:MAG: hypothetical protein WC829_23060 [Hyphomicrobium sp.]|jgi:hypothetical protein